MPPSNEERGLRADWELALDLTEGRRAGEGEEGGAGPLGVRPVDERQFQTLPETGRQELQEGTPLGEREGVW